MDPHERSRDLRDNGQLQNEINPSVTPGLAGPNPWKKPDLPSYSLRLAKFLLSGVKFSNRRLLRAIQNRMAGYFCE
ncbi:MAG TPA: hypothetical protein VLY83_02300 [Methanoregula sp.]|nr:hypothetical protein [Methanoregula sp.]